MTNTASSNTDIVKTWWRRVWDEQDEAAIHDLYRPGGMAKGLGDQPLAGPDDFVAHHRQMLTLLSDTQVQVDKAMEDGDWVTTLVTFRAKGRACGTPVSITGTGLVRIADGTIAEAHNHFDFPGLFAQLGLMPEDWFAKGMAGEKIFD